MKKKYRLTAAIFLISLLLNGCSEKPKRLLLHLYDVSESATANAEFVKATQQVCHGIIETANSNALLTRIAVSAEVKAVDPERINYREKLHQDCQKQPQPKGRGTFVCPAWQLALDIINRYPNYRPVVINQIQTNELEPFCSSTLKELTNKINEREGKLVVVGSTNDGNKPFNSQLWSALKSSPNNIFCNTNVKACVGDSINSVR